MSTGETKLRILVVDDERDMVLTLTTLLRHEGHVVEAVYRAQDVMRAVKDFDPDVVLVDIALPDGSGYGIAEHIRRRAGTQRPMIIALTGSTSGRRTTSCPASSAAITSSPSLSRSTSCSS